MPAKKSSKRKYSKGSQNEVKKEMRRFKKGTAKSGRGKTKVKNRKQAIAIGLSKARKKGSKVPKKATKKSTKKSAAKTSRKKKSTTPRKKSAKKATRKTTRRRKSTAK